MPTLALPTNYIVGYVRVSKMEQGHGWSPTNQEAEIRRFAARHQLQVAGVFYDIGRSGSTLQNRLGLLDLLTMVQQGGIGAVVAWREDRLARRVRTVKALSHAIFKAKAHIITLVPFVHDQGPAHAQSEAALIRPLLQVQAEEEWHTTRRRVLPGVISAAQNGRRGGHIPFGYKRLADGTIIIDEVAATFVRQWFRAIVDGDNVTTLVRRCAERGERHVDGRPFTTDLIRGVLQNSYMHGTLYYKPPVVDPSSKPARICHDNHHPALVDRALFSRVQQIFEKRRNRAQSYNITDEQHAKTTNTELLSSQSAITINISRTFDVAAAISGPTKRIHGIIPPDVVRCGHCGGTMYASLQTCGARGRRRQVAKYICHRHKNEGRLVCPQTPASTAEIDANVAIEVRKAIHAGVFSHIVVPTAPPVIGDLDEKIVAVEKKLQSLRDAIKTGVASAVLTARLAQVEADSAALAAERQRVVQTHRLPSGPRWRVLSDFDANWPACSQAEQRTIISWLCKEIHIDQNCLKSITFAQNTIPAESL